MGFLKSVAEPDVASNGEEALQVLRLALREQQFYDVIFLDIMMPGMDGQEVLKKIRELEAEAGITGLDGVKVVMTSALQDSKNVMEAFWSGCEAYLIKPLKKADVMAKLEKLGLLDSADA